MLLALGIGAICLIAGGIYGYSTGDQLRYLPDEAEYVSLATNLAQKYLYSLDGLQPTAYKPPGYPLILGAVRWLGGNIVSFRLINFVLFVGGLFFLYQLARQTGGVGAGLLSVILATAGYPVLFYTANTLYPQTLAGFLFLAVIWLYERRVSGIWQGLLVGIVWGWLILTVPTFVFTFLLFGLAYCFIRRQKKFFGWIGVGTFLILGLWTIRNYVVFHDFVWIATNSGYNLLLGNSEKTTFNSGTNVDIQKYLDAAEGMGELEKDRYFRTQAIAYILAHPAEAIQFYLLKTVNFFNFRNELTTRSETSLAREALMGVTYGALLLLALLRLVGSQRFKLTSFESLLYAVYVGNAFWGAIFFNRIRFRLPYDYLLILLSAIFLSQFIASRYENS